MSSEEAEKVSGTRTAADYRDIADSLRTRVDLYGKSLAGLATVGTGAVGIAKLSDLFPENADVSWAGVSAAVLGLLAAALGAVTIAVMLMKAGDAAVVEIEDASRSPEETALITPIFGATARRFGMTTMPALAEKEHRLRRAATRLPAGAARTAREARADELRGEIDLALARGQVAVVRNRSTKAVSGTLAKWCYAAVAVGLVVFALGADGSSQDRDDQIATAKSCAEARKAGATSDELTGAGCSTPATPPSGAAGPSPEVLRTSLALRLSRLLTLCEQEVALEQSEPPGSKPFGRADCDVLRDAITATVSTGRER